MALYLGDKLIAGGGTGSGNANVVSCNDFRDYEAKRDANLAAGKLSVSYYIPDTGGPDVDDSKYAKLNRNNVYDASFTNTFNGNVTVATGKKLEVTNTLSANSGTLTAAKLTVNGTTNLNGATNLKGATTTASLTVTGATNLSSATTIGINGRLAAANNGKTELTDTDTLIMSDSTKSYNVSYSTLVEDLKKKLPVDDPTKFTITTLESGLYENELTSANMLQVYGFQRVAYNAVVDGTQYELHEWVKRYEDSTAEIHIGANPLMYGNSFTSVTKCAGFTIWSNDDYLLLKTDSNVKDGDAGNFPKRAGYVYEFPSMQPQTGITIAENGELADKTHYPNSTCMSFYTFDNKLTTGIYTKDSKTNVVGYWDVKSFGIVIPPHTIICSAPEYMSNNGHHGYRQLADDTNITYVDGTSIKTLTNVAIPEDNLAEYYLSIYKVPEIAFDSLYGFWYMR